MCGICGEIRFAREGRVNSDLIKAMREQLVHRGPDDSGLFVSADGQVGLGFRRLRIVDLSASANQPLTNEDGSIQLVFNGEVYNFQALRRQLLARGHQFRSHSDAEVIVHLYEEQGTDCLRDLEGMFAFAIWDQRTERLILARDRAGKKPLFYYRSADRLVFASEIKSFFAHPEIPTEIDPGAIPYYFLYGYVPCPDTFYRGVKQLEPATVLAFERDGTVHSEAYWQLQYPARNRVAPSPTIGSQEASGRIRSLLTEAVERRLVSDVPIGAFLSGGVDSTIVVGLMSRLMSEPVKTFSIGFEGDPAYDETRYARLVAERFGTDHTEFIVKPSAVDLVEKLIWHHDGPFGDASAVPTYIVSQLTRQHVTVVLNGDGGDEVFAGYKRFYASVVSEKIPPTVGRGLDAVLSRIPPPASDRHWVALAQRFASAMNLPFYERITRWISLFYEDLEHLIAPELFHAGFDRLRYLDAEREQMEGLSTLGKVLHANFKFYLLNDLLVKMDRCAMANSLEARSPFLDTALVDYVATLPDAMKLRAGKTKVILREAFADLLPSEVSRRGKMGFGVPLGTWFRHELRDYLADLLLSSNARYRTYLSAPYVHALVKRHQAGTTNAGLQLWSLLCFELWLQALPGWTRPNVAPVVGSR